MTTLTTKRNLLPTWANDLFDTGRNFMPALFDFNGGFPNWNLSSRLPEVNIRETEKDFRMEMAVPGMQKKDFQIHVENNVLTISSEKQEESTEKKENYTRREFSYNSFSRSFNLPDNCLADKIDARYENGLLMITLPKKEVTPAKSAKEIKIQ
jgi:HSP20 family protein